MTSPRTLTRMGLLTATALILFLVESAVPRPLPWVRLGLGNAAVLAALLWYGPGPALSVTVARLLLGGLLSGSLAGPAFVIGGAAGLASLAVMVLLRRVLPRFFSPVGLSIAGALVHQLTQLAVAAAYLGHGGLYSLVPIFLVSGVLSGSATGLVTYFVVQRLGRGDLSP